MPISPAGSANGSNGANSGGGGGAVVAQHAAEENRQALMLFAIVVFFIVFNTPRNFLNLYELVVFDEVIQSWNHGCKALKLWVLLVGTVSHLLLVINSSLNFFLYCGMSTTFRNELSSLGKRAFAHLKTVTTRRVAGMARERGSGSRSDYYTAKEGAGAGAGAGNKQHEVMKRLLPPTSSQAKATTKV